MNRDLADARTLLKKGAAQARTASRALMAAAELMDKAAADVAVTVSANNKADLRAGEGVNNGERQSVPELDVRS